MDMSFPPDRSVETGIWIFNIMFFQISLLNIFIGFFSVFWQCFGVHVDVLLCCNSSDQTSHPFCVITTTIYL